jgi:hypothetical protein
MDRKERIEAYIDTPRFEVAEMLVDLEDSLTRTIEERDFHARNWEVVTREFFEYQKKQELDPSRLESALRMYITELDYDRHKNIECGEEDGLDHYPEEVDYFLRGWETVGEG